MKRILFSLFVSLLLTACNSRGDGDTSDEDSTAKEDSPATVQDTTSIGLRIVPTGDYAIKDSIEGR